MKARESRLTPDQVNTLEDPSNQNNTTAQTTAPASAGINKRFLKPLRIIILILAVVFAVFLIFQFLSRPYDKTDNKYADVTVEVDDDLHSVSDLLEESGIIMKASRFEMIARAVFLTDFKPGTYYLSPSMNSVDIARTMVYGLTRRSGFTIPSGYTVEQIAASLERDGFVDQEEFLTAASDKALQEIDFIGKDIDGPEQVEGFLFPGDYSFDQGADEYMIIMTMLDGFSNYFDEDLRARADELEMSTRDIIVIASMIESETSNIKEMPDISSVIHNKISLGMIKKKNFPDVPLCSPGEDAINAALYPAESENTYYVLSSKLDGSHVFTSDKKEYKELKKEYEDAVSEREAERDLQE